MDMCTIAKSSVYIYMVATNCLWLLSIQNAASTIEKLDFKV